MYGIRETRLIRKELKQIFRANNKSYIHKKLELWMPHLAISNYEIYLLSLGITYRSSFTLVFQCKQNTCFSSGSTTVQYWMTVKVGKNGYFFWISKCFGCQKLSLGSLLTKKKIFLKKCLKPREPLWGQISSLPLKFPFLKIFKIIVESLLIAHSIGNFILKNINTGHSW